MLLSQSMKISISFEIIVAKVSTLNKQNPIIWSELHWITLKYIESTDRIVERIAWMFSADNLDFEQKIQKENVLKSRL
jgi:hypothetical protein